ncbi:4252_t:CDS:2, partial [Paraglomus brasilianum]
ITDYPPHQLVPPLKKQSGHVPQLKEKSWSFLTTNEAKEGLIRDYVNSIGYHRSNPSSYSYTPSSSQQSPPAYLSLHKQLCAPQLFSRSVVRSVSTTVFPAQPDDSMWTNKEKIENYRVSRSEIEEDENCTPSGINSWKEEPYVEYCRRHASDNESHVALCHEEVIQHRPIRLQAAPVYELPVRRPSKHKNVFDEYFIPKRHCNEPAVTAIEDYIAFKKNGEDLYVHAI